MVVVQEDMDLFHLVLFYLYTEQITFTESPLPEGVNVATNAEEVYKIAHSLMIPSLEDKAAHFLRATTNVENISRRTFGEFAREHGRLGGWYDEWFLGRWEAIKGGGGVEEVFEGLEGDWEEYVRVSKKFRGMIGSLKLR
jgi:hypothetical protein